MILPTWPRELLLCLHSQVFFLLVNEWEWAKAVQKFSSALQPFNVIQPKVFCSCSATHDTPFDQLVYLFLACLLALHPAIQMGNIGTFLHVRSHILLFFMYKIAQISGIKNTQSPHNSLICVPVQNANPMRNPKRAKAKGVNTCCIILSHSWICPRSRPERLSLLKLFMI